MVEPSYADHKLEAYAKSQGFPDYASMAAFYRHRSEGLKQSSGPPPSQFRVSDLLSLHPSILLDYVKRKFDSATGNDQR